MENREKKGRGRVIINKNLCKGCELCIIVCPKGLIGLDGKINQKGYHPAVLMKEGCTGCGFCAMMCPDAIIRVYRDR